MDKHINKKTLDTYLSLCTEVYDLSKSNPPEDADAFYCDYAIKANCLILEPMCGTGRFLLPLLEEGFNAHGFDASDHMLKTLHAKAKVENLKPTVWKGFAEDLNRPEKYNLIFIPSSSFCLIIDPVQVEKSLKAIYDHLSDDGVFLFEAETLKAVPQEGIWRGLLWPKPNGQKIILSQLAIVLLWMLVGFSNLAIANTYDSIEYNLNLTNIKDSVLKVDIIFRGKFKDKLVLDLPFKWAGTTYTNQIKNIQVDPQFQMEMIKKDNNSQVILIMPKASTDPIKVTYEVHQKVGNPSNVHETIVRDDLVHAPGYGIFATPYELNETDKVKIIINWVNLDSTWKTLSSYGASSNLKLNITAPELLRAIYVAGKIRLYNIGTDSSTIFLSLYGRFDMKDQRILSDLREIINGQRRFFNDFDFPYYAISLIEGDNPQSMGGTRLSSSFTAFLPREMHKTDYYILFAHEHLHNWIGGKIRNNKDKELNYWWTEGFTDFYSRLIALRSRGIDRNIFINEINQFLRSYYLSPVNKEPNLRIKKDFWNDYNIEKLPYYRGLVFALYLNNLIQKENPDVWLDNVIHDLFNVAYEQQFSSILFKDVVHRYVKNGIDKEITSFIDNGDIISLELINLPIAKISMGRYHLGFDRDALLKDKLIQGIDIKSNAYKAGLRNGQKITAWDCPKGKGEPDQIITIKTTAKTFKFKPEHYNKIEIYQLKTDLLPQEEEQFNKFFSIK